MKCVISYASLGWDLVALTIFFLKVATLKFANNMLMRTGKKESSDWSGVRHRNCWLVLMTDTVLNIQDLLLNDKHITHSDRGVYQINHVGWTNCCCESYGRMSDINFLWSAGFITPFVQRQLWIWIAILRKSGRFLMQIERCWLSGARDKNSHVPTPTMRKKHILLMEW